MKWLPRWVAMISGCASLAIEVLWMRVIGFAESGRAEVFSVVLGAYLLGIALGAFFGRRLCRGAPEASWTGIALLLLASAIFDPVSIIVFSRLAPEFGGYLAALPWIVGGAALKGAVFPVVHHLGSNQSSESRGASFSSVYLFNLIGCTIGPAALALFTLDHFSAGEHFAAISVILAFTATVLFIRLRRVPFVWLALPVIPVLWVMPDPLRAVAVIPEGHSIVFWLENKEGVIHSTGGKSGVDTVYGGNVYDGRINIDLRTNQNRIDRVHALMLAHPGPVHALVIGVSGGSWARVISGYPGVERIDAVEINPGYRLMIEQYQDVKPLLVDARFNMIVDDGRRWLKNHPGSRYDVIAINSTFHWRSGATNLLSYEFLAEVRRHLKPGGIVLLNATGSVDVAKTAASVFPHAYGYGNSILMSDVDFRPTLRGSVDRIFEVTLGNDVDLKNDSPSDREIARQVSEHVLLGIDDAERKAQRQGEVVTDFNMLSEYRYADQ